MYISCMMKQGSRFRSLEEEIKENQLKEFCSIIACKDTGSKLKNANMKKTLHLNFQIKNKTQSKLIQLHRAEWRTQSSLILLNN